MTKKQKNFRLSDSTLQKLDFLGRRYGTDTTALEIAIDRLYQAEQQEAKESMSAKSKIQAKVKEVYDDNAPNVYKGTDYDGSRQDTGWWYRPFNAQPIWLGKSVAAAIDTLDDIAEYRQADR